MENNKLLEVNDLRTYFYTEEGVVPSVDGLSFDLSKNETLAIVGESGCGKSVTSLSILRLIASPGKIVTGSIKYNGEDLTKKSEREMMKIRGKDISMIFQEPMTSLNPVFTIGHQIYESLKYHENADKKTGIKKAIELLQKVGIPDAEEVVNEYPHQLSGGMRQRVMIAMALACNPKILIADEPTTALDVTIQAQILNLLKDLKKEMDTAIILITHDLGVVAQIAENVMVMYAGEAVEKAEVKELYANPLHPYTLGLLKSIPNLKEDKESLYNIPGTVPNPMEYAKGCRFAPRCEKCMDCCINESPKPTIIDSNHSVRCWLYSGGDDHE